MTTCTRCTQLGRPERSTLTSFVLHLVDLPVGFCSSLANRNKQLQVICASGIQTAIKEADIEMSSAKSGRSAAAASANCIRVGAHEEGRVGRCPL
jgi:hypothetical protein